MSKQLSRLTFVVQDGAQFYDDANGGLIAEYPDLVQNDYDMEGAYAARRQFLAEHGNVVFLNEDGTEQGDWLYDTKEEA